MNNGVDTAKLKTLLIAEAEAQGFVSIGFTDAANNPQQTRRLHEWIEAGYHASMGWMEERAAVRAGPQAMWSEAQSVIALGMSYAPTQQERALTHAPNRGQISAYAQGKDYHILLKKRLKALVRWMVEQAKQEGLGESALKLFVDTAPVMEKPLAQKAGIGWQGKHSNLVSPVHGSWLFLGVIYTTIPFEPDPVQADQCGSCTACLAACPTDAFPTPYVVDARRCVSYLTIEHKGVIAEEFKEPIGNRIYGCDDCLAACPWNKFADSAARNQAFIPREDCVSPPLGELLKLDDGTFRAKFSGSPIKRIGVNRFLRNCLIAAGNSQDAGLKEQVGEFLDHDDSGVQDAAQWAYPRL